MLAFTVQLSGVALICQYQVLKKTTPDEVNRQSDKLESQLSWRGARCGATGHEYHKGLRRPKWSAQVNLEGDGWQSLAYLFSV